MLDRTSEKLKSYYDNEAQLCSDGRMREIDSVTRIARHELEGLMAMYREVGPDASIESGLAYGFSTIAILDFLEETGRGHHFAIDPTQIEMWHGIALSSVEQLGFSSRLTWINARSDQAFASLIREQQRVQFVFLDGLQFFDAIITDFFMADQILDPGGLIVFNQSWMPGGRSARSFITNNKKNYKARSMSSGQFFAFEKTAKDDRPWDHFVPFDGSGHRDGENKPPNRFFRKWLNRKGLG